MTTAAFSSIDEMRHACLDATGHWPVTSRVLAVVFVLGLTVAIFAVRQWIKQKRERTVETGSLKPELVDWIEILSPAVSGLVVFICLFSVLSASGFYRAGMNATPLLFLAVADVDGSTVAAELAARSTWAVTFAAVVIASVVALWIAAGAWLDCESRTRSKLARYVSVPAVGVGIFLTLRGLFGGATEFGSNLSGDLVCATLNRTGLFNLGPLTDGLNVIGIAVPVVVAWAFCMVLVPTTHAGAQLKVELGKFSRSQAMLDQVLYAGAAVLMAGLLEIVALVSWSYAPFPSIADVKVHSEICRTSSAAPLSGGVAVTKRIEETGLCRSIAVDADRAAALEDVRKFVRSLALVFGASFSALLLAFYAPAAAILQRRLVVVLGAKPKGMSKEELTASMEALGVERSIWKRSLGVAAALGPLAAGAVSAILTA